MMEEYFSSKCHIFPFGLEVKKVQQGHSSKKEYFILGDCAGAVHAKWINDAGKELVKAMAVASEPEIFWKGDTTEALQILNTIKLPKGCGKLIPADEQFNGPSGRSLDDLFLTPLGVTRKDAWLCDLLPYARLNPGQKTALEREYNPIASSMHLPKVTIPEVPKTFADAGRVKEITQELVESKATVIVTLGDLPIKEYITKASNVKVSNLKKVEPYGTVQKITIDGKSYSWIALVHPRQAGKLGLNSAEWEQKHMEWMTTAKKI